MQYLLTLTTIFYICRIFFIRIQRNAAVKVFTFPNMDVENEKAGSRLQNELRVLFSRGKKELNLYVPDIKVITS